MSLHDLHFLQPPVLDLPHPGLGRLQLVRAERFVGQDPDYLTKRSQQQTRIKQTIDKFLVRCKKTANCHKDRFVGDDPNYRGGERGTREQLGLHHRHAGGIRK